MHLKLDLWWGICLFLCW